MKRIFIAIKIIPGNDLIEVFNFLKKQFQLDRIWWASFNNLHLTLKFIGDLPEDTIEILKNELKQISSIPKLRLHIEGIHLFVKNHHDPSVIFTSIKSGEELFNLVKEINTCVENAGIKIDKKKFVPHITLGRIKYLTNKSILEEILNDYRNENFQDVDCAEFILYESTLTPQGSIYTPLEIYKL